MNAPGREEFTAAIESLSRGDPRAADQLVPVLYEELRRLAAAHLRRERKGHTLQPTALVHEVYLRLVGGERADWEDRAHFFAWAARTMRQVLVSHARRRRAQKRGGGQERLPLDAVSISFEENAIDLAALDEALEKLAAIDPRKSRIVELRFFGGLSIPEVAKVLEISHATVEREWNFARSWLYKTLAP